jgi:PIN domain nuclease of toxin-antitoxin system
MSKPILLDASCILAWAFGEPGADQVESVLPAAYIAAVNITEVIDKLERRGDEGVELATDLISWGLAVVPFGWPHMNAIPIVRAAQERANARKRLSLGDRFCLAYCVQEEMEIWTADPFLVGT